MIYLLIGIGASAAVTLILKAAGNTGGNRYALLFANYITCALLSLAHMKTGFQADISTVIFGLCGGFFYVFGLVMMQKSIAVNGASLTGAFSKLGLLVPIGMSLLVFREQPGIARITGILLAVAAVMVINSGGRRAEHTISSALLIGAWLGCGCSDAMAKIFESFGNPVQESCYFLILFCTASVLTMLLYLYDSGKQGTHFSWRDISAGVMVGIPNYFSASLLIAALRELPSLLVYPSFSVGSLLVILALSRILFGETITRKELSGIVLILAALVFLNV